MSEPFLSGAASMGFLVIALFFLRFWHETRDRLFLYFAGAFVLLLVERVCRAGFEVRTEWAPMVYLLRLVAFVLIIIGVVVKNRRA